MLEDPREALPSYDAIVLLSPRVADDTDLIETLRPLLGSIDVETMREANYTVDRQDNKWSPERAGEWLLEQVGI